MNQWVIKDHLHVNRTLHLNILLPRSVRPLLTLSLIMRYILVCCSLAALADGISGRKIGGVCKLCKRARVIGMFVRAAPWRTQL
jgi:hypothetical protein